MQKITPFLWFNNDAEKAMDFYISIFKNSKILHVSRLKNVPGPQSTVITGAFQIEGQEFMVLNGGPAFNFTPAVSFFITCDTQEEIDDYWNKLLADGGKPSRCGWLQDRFGLSWQVVPSQLGKLLNDPDPVKAKKVMEAMLKMDKIDIATLEEARG